MAADDKPPQAETPSLSNYLNDRRLQRKVLDMIVNTPGARHPDKPSPPSAPDLSKDKEKSR
ncbi:MAG: hypothetical protein KGL40_00910 [Rhodocyclaceae bacterium]|nr:hypothetical protein [Rhodocyclaceae bacterium]